MINDFHWSWGKRPSKWFLKTDVYPNCFTISYKTSQSLIIWGYVFSALQIREWDELNYFVFHPSLRVFPFLTMHAFPVFPIAASTGRAQNFLRSRLMLNLSIRWHRKLLSSIWTSAHLGLSEADSVVWFCSPHPEIKCQRYGIAFGVSLMNYIVCTSTTKFTAPPHHEQKQSRSINVKSSEKIGFKRRL